MKRSITRRRAVTGMGTLLVGASLAGCAGGGGGGSGGTRTVEMTDSLVFEPDALSIAVGDTVVWENVGQVPHTVTAYEDELPSGGAYFASGGFSSEQAARDAYPDGSIADGESYEHTFQTAGAYDYFCIPHESAGMTGTIDVRGGASY